MIARRTRLIFLSVGVLVLGFVAWRVSVVGPSMLGRLLPGNRGPANVLIITLDTTRADHLGSYGYARGSTPRLDELAARGARFREAITVTPLTLPAHSSLMTGTFPMFHGVRDNGGFYLGEDQTTLAEILRAKGYRTGGFVSAFVLDSRWGINQGFDTYFDNFDLDQAKGGGMDEIQRPAQDVIDKALEWLDKDVERPFFGWVHLYDPHTPYNAPEPFRSRFPRTLSGAYDAEIAYADQQLGRLIDRLADDGRLDRTLVIVLGDHGESLGQHREQTHGFFVYEPVLHIPLIMAGPTIEPRVVPDQVRIVDVMPTVLDLLGMPKAPGAQGSTLASTLRGESFDAPAFAECWFPRYHYGWSELMTIRDGRYKYIAAPRPELYDLENDAGELNNIAATSPARIAALGNALRDLVERSASKAATQGPQRVDPDVEERLRALGYVGASVSRRNLEERPRGDPKDKIELYNLLKLAGTDSVQDRIDDAIAKVKQALADDPDIVEGYTMLGNLHIKAKRPEQAIEAYRRALALDPEHEGATFSLALAYKQAGRMADAEAGFERSQELDPRSGKALWQLADIWMQRRDFERAEAGLQKALSMKVDRPTFLLKLGECQIEMKKYEKAEESVLAALKEKPNLQHAQYDLGLIYDARGATAQAMRAYETEISNYPTAYRAAFNLAKLLQESGRLDEAIRRYRESVTANPAFGSGYLYLAKALLDASDLKGAEEAARAGLGKDVEKGVKPLGHYVLADVYNRQGRSREAAREAAMGKRLEESH